MPATSPIKAVIFDWAGTMIDFGCMSPIMALIDAFAAEGVVLDEADARRDMGRAKRDHVAALMAHPTVAAAWEAAKGVPPTMEDEVRIYAALEPLMQASAARRTELIPGAAGVAQWLQGQGIKVGSCTGYTPQMMQAILPRAAEQGYEPDVVVCAGDTPSGRPSPQMVWKALTTLDIWPASACVKVDDAPVGIEEGRNAGCWTIGLAASGNGVGLTLEQYEALSEADRAARVDASARLLKAAGADFVIDSVADIRPVLEEIASRIAVSQSS